jgi:steroid delta-isomerase-like uncharacterized protein
MSESNKQVMRQIFEEAFNSGDFDLIDDLVVEDYVDHDPNNPPDLPPGRQGLKALMAGYRAAFPDMVMTIDDQVAEGDKVVSRWTARGTHNGELMGVSPTGKQVVVTGIFIDRIVDGKVSESWAGWDGLGLMRQIGAA